MPWKSRWWTRWWRRRPRLSRMHPKIPDRMQAKFDDLNHRLDHLHETTRKLSKRLDAIDWRLAGLETKPPK
jgi:hypothetical protein